MTLPTSKWNQIPGILEIDEFKSIGKIKNQHGSGYVFMRGSNFLRLFTSGRFELCADGYGMLSIASGKLDFAGRQLMALVDLMEILERDGGDSALTCPPQKSKAEEVTRHNWNPLDDYPDTPKLSDPSNDTGYDYRQYPNRAHRQLPRVIWVTPEQDLFHHSVATIDIIELFGLMKETHRNKYMVQTRHTGRLRQILQSEEFNQRIGKYPSNVWIGASITNQTTAEQCIPDLLAIPDTHRFISARPLSRLVDFTRVLKVSGGSWDDISWLIVGNGPGIKDDPIHPTWIKLLAVECHQYGVPVMFTGWSKYRPCRLDHEPAEISVCLCGHSFGVEGSQPHICSLSVKGQPDNARMRTTRSASTAIEMKDGKRIEEVPEQLHDLIAMNPPPSADR
jgi:protein gp37